MIQHRHYIMLMPLFVAMVSFSHAAEQTPLKQELVLGTSGTAFTLNGTETFLLGASYYGALGIEDPKEVEADLRDLTRAGINWIRVWATWESDTVNISAVAPDGTLREPYMKRLVRLCERAQQQHMAVDVTVTRNKGSVYPSNQKEHCAVLAQLAQTLKPFRHVYFDVANERNIGDARHVPMDEVRDLIATVKSIDPQRLCTASQGGDISEGELKEYLMTAKVDFITPHRPRNPDSIRLTVTKTREYFHNMEALPHTVPILYQEPFRRGYSDWEPTVSDFLDDMQNARRAGAAGWCWHNGANKSAPDKRPRKSFDMRPSEGRLFKQLDSADQTVLSRFQPPPPVRRSIPRYAMAG